MKPLYPPPSSAQAKSLAQADAAASEQGRDDLAKQACPLQKIELAPAPLRLLMWHIHELGGGFYVQGARPRHCIEAYAKLITTLEADVVVLLGVARGQTSRVVSVKTGDGRRCLKMEPVKEEAGLLEVQAIVDALGGGWKAAAVRDEEGSIVYLEGETAAVLVREGSGVQLVGARLVQGPGDETLDLAPLLACFDLQLENGEDLPVMAHLRGGGEAKPEPTPPRGIIAVSAADDLVEQMASWNQIRGGFAADYHPVQETATVAAPLPWERIGLEKPRLIHSFTAINPSDVRTQDALMHWEALKAPMHPQKGAEVLGEISDSLLMYSDGREALATVEALRVVDLLAAAGEPAEALEEQGCLAPMFEQHIKQRARLAQTEDPDDEANRLAERLDFVNRLSRHWPVLLKAKIPAQR